MTTGAIGRLEGCSRVRVSIHGSRCFTVAAAALYRPSHFGPVTAATAH
jgi:hypothetical protein